MILLSIAIAGQGVAMGLLGILGLIVGVIIFIRVMLANKSKSSLTVHFKNNKQESPLENRHKYAVIDTFKWSSTFLNLGLVLAVLMTILAFSWTTYEEEVIIPEALGGLDEEVEVIRTSFPPPLPPPPPPPPPPVLEVATDETIEDEPEFEDREIEADEEVIAPPPVRKAPPPPPPTAPPPPKIEIDDVFKVVEQMPRFPGCEDERGKAAKQQCADQKLLTYIYKNIKYPAIARENGMEGTTVIRFVVEKDGSISNTEIIRNIGGQLGEEALRVVKKMATEKTWIAGQQRGEAVRVQFNLPIKFKLQ